VLFVPQELAAPEKCRELLPGLSNVEFVPFNQHETDFDQGRTGLGGLLGDPRYQGRRKAFIVLDLNRAEEDAYLDAVGKYPG